MDTSELKKFSDNSFNITVAKKNALERARSRQIVAHNGHLFRADPHTINLARTLSDQSGEFYILDVNDNPCLIKDTEEFLNLLIARNQESLNEYHRWYQTLKNRKSQ
jgi:hypothetical protein